MLPNILVTATETPTAMSSLGDVVTQVWTWFTGFIGTATQQPIILIPLGFGVAGATIGLFKRGTRVGGRRK